MKPKGEKKQNLYDISRIFCGFLWKWNSCLPCRQVGRNRKSIIPREFSRTWTENRTQQCLESNKVSKCGKQPRGVISALEARLIFESEDTFLRGYVFCNNCLNHGLGFHKVILTVQLSSCSRWLGFRCHQLQRQRRSRIHYQNQYQSQTFLDIFFVYGSQIFIVILLDFSAQTTSIFAFFLNKIRWNFFQILLLHFFFTYARVPTLTTDGKFFATLRQPIRRFY